MRLYYFTSNWDATVVLDFGMNIGIGRILSFFVHSRTWKIIDHEFVVVVHFSHDLKTVVDCWFVWLVICDNLASVFVLWVQPDCVRRDCPVLLGQALAKFLCLRIINDETVLLRPLKACIIVFIGHARCTRLNLAYHDSHLVTFSIVTSHQAWKSPSQALANQICLHNE